MLKLSLGVTLFLASTLPVIAADSPFYLGGQLSSTELKESALGSSESFDFTTLSVLAGYQFTPFLAAEIRLGTGVDGESYRELDYVEELEVTQQRLLLLKGTVPISDAFALYGVAGYGATKFRYTERFTGYYYSDSETIDGLSWGVGAGLSITPKLSATFEYLQMPSESYNEDGFGYKLKSHNVSLGIIYQF